MLPVKLDDLIEVAVRLAPDTRSREGRSPIATDVAAGSRRDQAWIVTSHAEYSATPLAENVEAAAVLGGRAGSGCRAASGSRESADRRQLSVEAGIAQTNVEYNIYDRAARQAGQRRKRRPARTSNSNPYEFLLAEPTIAALRRSSSRSSRGFGPDVALATEQKADLAGDRGDDQGAARGRRDGARHRRRRTGSSRTRRSRSTSARKALDLAKKQEQLTHEQIRAGAAPSNALNAVTYEIRCARRRCSARSSTSSRSRWSCGRKSGLEIGRRDIVMQPGEPFDDRRGRVRRRGDRSRAATRRTASSRRCSSRRRSPTSTSRSPQDQVKPQLDVTALRAR